MATLVKEKRVNNKKMEVLAQKYTTNHNAAAGTAETGAIIINFIVLGVE